MSHLTAAELIDLAEGAQSEASAAHLQACGACREHLAALRATMSIVAEVDAPEPSPLFWDHFSARVRDAVEADRESTSRVPREGRNAGADASLWLGWRPVWVAALAVLITGVGLVIRVSHQSTVAAPAPIVAAILEISPDMLPAEDDPSLSLVADLAADLDWESAGDAGLATHVGADDDAVNQLTDGERRELRQLLQGELSRSRRGA